MTQQGKAGRAAVGLSVYASCLAARSARLRCCFWRLRCLPFR